MKYKSNLYSSVLIFNLVIVATIFAILYVVTLEHHIAIFSNLFDSVFAVENTSSKFVLISSEDKQSNSFADRLLDMLGGDEPAESLRYFNESLGFSIEYPQDWNYNESRNKVSFYPSKGDDSFDVNVNTINFSSYGDTLLSNFTLSNRDKFQISLTFISGFPAIKTNYSTVKFVAIAPIGSYLADSDSSDIYLLNGEKLYTIEYNTTRHFHDAEIHNMIDSFRIVNASSKLPIGATSQ